MKNNTICQKACEEADHQRLSGIQDNGSLVTTINFLVSFLTDWRIFKAVFYQTLVFVYYSTNILQMSTCRIKRKRNALEIVKYHFETILIILLARSKNEATGEVKKESKIFGGYFRKPQLFIKPR